MKFAVLGGDLRQVWVAKGLRTDGYRVGSFALGGAPGSESELQEAVSGADYLVLPLPAFLEDGRLNCSGPCRPTPEELLDLLRPEVRVFGGRLQREAAVFAAAGIPAVDYLQLESVAAANAVPTAEGALRIAMEQMPVTLQGSRCLVIGWGRIGKILSRKLQLLGASVTVAARNPAHRAIIDALELRSDTTGRFYYGLQSYDLIVNTVPAQVLGQAELAQIPSDCLILDLASKPGGIDWQTAERLGRNAVQALGLPGKTAPVTAGLIIKDGIRSYLDSR